jgi:hypothetical protein
MLFPFSSSTQNITKTLVANFVSFCKLASCRCLTTTVTWACKIIVLLSQVVWRVWRKDHLFPRVRYKPLSHPCVETSLVASLCAWSPNEWHLKIRVAGHHKTPNPVSYTSLESPNAPHRSSIRGIPNHIASPRLVHSFFSYVFPYPLLSHTTPKPHVSCTSH